MGDSRTNWGGNYVYQAARVHSPTTFDELRSIVTGSTKLRVLGSRHSFNPIADTSGDQISLEHFNRILEIDPERGTATIEGGATYSQIAPALHEAGFALHNLASLPHISVAGACATATHGSGNANGNLATSVVALELLTADGDVVQLSRDDADDTFFGAVVGLGALGVVTKLTLKVEPTFLAQQAVYEELPWHHIDESFDQISGAAYSVSLFTDWRPDWINQVWLKDKLADANARPLEPTFFGARLAPTHRHPITDLSAEPCTPQMGQPGPWYDRLPHFRIGKTPSNGAELQSEYFVPRRHAVAAIRAVAQLHSQIVPHLLISEIRTVAADTFWMSPSYQQEIVGLHFTWKRDWPAVQQLLPRIEAVLAPFEVRPHWGKLFTLSPADVQRHYTQLDAFRALINRYDPRGVFRNSFIDAYIFG